jgi:hypothetical protein
MARIKGTATLLVVKSLRAHKAEARKTLSPHLHYYLEDRIIVGGWYPEEDHVDLLRALAKILPMSETEAYELMGRSSAREDLSKIYNNMFVPGDIAGTLKKTAVRWRLYHDTGRILIRNEGPGRGTRDLVGYEAPSPEMCIVMGAWTKEMLLMAGARDAEIVHSRCCCKGDPMCRWETKWTEP